MREINHFAGRLIAFDKKGEGDQTAEGETLIEVVDFTDAAEVEIAFTDRNERCYLKFPIEMLLSGIGALVGTKQ